MKGKILFILLLLLTAYNVSGQYYKLEYNFGYNGDGVRFYGNVYYTTSNNSTHSNFVSLYQHNGSKVGSINIPISNGEYARIRTDDGYVQMKTIFGWNTPTRGNETFSFDFTKDTTEITFNEVKNYWLEYYWSLAIIPYVQNRRYSINYWFKLYPVFKKTTKNIHSLPSDTKVQLSFTAGFPKEAYLGRWQYLIANGDWIKVPDSLIDVNNPHYINVCSRDLMDEESIRKHTGSSIQFRISNPVKEDCSDKIILTIQNPSIQVKEINATQPKCNGDFGSLEIVLQNPLRENEEVLHFINDENHSNDQRKTISSDRKLITLKNLNVEKDKKITLKSVVTTYRDSIIRIYDPIIKPPRPRPEPDPGPIIREDVFPFVTPNDSMSIERLIYRDSIIRIEEKQESAPYYIDVAQHLKNPDSVTFDVDTMRVRCHGESTGEITVTPSGGTGIYTIKLNGVVVADGVTGGHTINNLAAGEYTIDVQDSNGCSHDAAQSITIGQPAPLSIDNITLTAPRGYHTHDGQIEVLVSGGTATYIAYCIDSLNAHYPLEIQPDGTFKNSTLHRGRYRIVVEDSLGCEAVRDTFLNSPTELTVRIEQVAGIGCHGHTSGRLTARADGGVGGYNLKWGRIDGTDIISIIQPQSLAAGLYRVVVIDGNGIKDSAEYELTQPEPISIEFPVVTPPTCGNQHQGRIEAAVQGGTQPYSYQWSNGETTDIANIVNGGLHNVVIIDANGCEAENSITVEAPGELSVSHTATAPTCYGLSDGRIELEVSGGMAPYTVRWADELWETPATLPALAQRGPNALADEDSGGPDFGGQLTRTNLPAGRYEAVVTDATGCEVAVSVVLEQPEPIALWLGHDITLCSGARALLSAQTNRHGLRYSWRTPWGFAQQNEPHLWVDAAGSYAVTATDSAGCMATDTVRVLQGVEELPLDITAPSSAAARATVHAVNLSPEGVQHVRWILPAEAEVVRSNDAEAVFIMPRSGMYQIAFEARTDRCSATIGQPLEILDTLVLPSSDDVPLIQQFLLSPSGLQLAVRVELREASRMVLNLLSPDGRLIDQHVQPSAKMHTHRFALKGLPAGDYQVVLQVGGQVATMRFTKRE